MYLRYAENCHKHCCLTACYPRSIVDTYRYIRGNSCPLLWCI